MYNGIGLQTPRGSGTSGYIQSNKFSVKPKSSGQPGDDGKRFEAGQGIAGLSTKPNTDILEHERKRQIYLELVMLREKLIYQGYSDAEIALKLGEARRSLAAAPSVSRISETQTHQIGARKEKQIEAYRAVLGLPRQQTDDCVHDEQKRDV